MEKTGNRWWPYLGAVYLICAIKRVHGVHLINPAFSKAPGRLFQTVSVNRKSKGTSASKDEMAGENR